MNTDLFTCHEFLTISDSAKWLYITICENANADGILDYDLENINFMASPMVEKDYQNYLTELRVNGLICLGKRIAGNKMGGWVIGTLCLRVSRFKTPGIEWNDVPLKLTSDQTFIPDVCAYLPMVSSKKSHVTEEEISEIFEIWKDLLQKGDRAKLNEARKRSIINARKEYSQADVVQAVKNLPLSEFHFQKYNDLTTILKIKNIEMFRDLN